MMKEKNKRVIIAVLVIAGILLYGQYMNAEKRGLSRDLNQLNYRIKRLEIDKTMQKIIDLKAQNSLMQEKIIKLQDGLVKLRLEKAACQNQRDQNKPSPPTKGNRGYFMSK